MNNFPRYESYKDSGVDWLGKIPEHWEAVSLGSLLELKSDKNHPEFEVLSVYREYGVIKKDSRDDNHNATSLDTTTYKAVEPGDLVVNKMKAWQGSMGISPYKGIVSPAYITCKITSKKIHSEYLHRLLRSSSYIGEYNRISYGVRVGQWDMHYEDFKRVTVVLPPIKEQVRIAEFLDHKTVQIDQAIAQKERLIELLQERRQILIHNAVTRGLNANVKMKDSGVDWIGEIPESWELIFMNYAINTIADVDHYMPLTIESGVPYVMTGDLKEFASDIDFESCKKISQRDYFNLSKKIKSTIGDVILARYATIGTASYVNIDLNFIVSYSCVTIKTNPSKLLGLYLFYYFKSDAFATDIKNQVNTNTQGNVGIGNLKKVKLVIPPINEQLEISKYIESANTKFTTAISFKEQEIEKLKEYKATLINSAVTGKIKVSDNN